MIFLNLLVRHFILRGSLFFLFILLLSCNSNIEIISNNDFDTLEFNDFVEDGFPFIGTSLDLRDLGVRFPHSNYSARALAVQLGDSSYMAFDTDLLRWSVAWTGDFVSMTGVAQVSYKDFFSKKNHFPKVLGDVGFATGIYAGWTNYRPDFRDIRNHVSQTDSLKWGPIPLSHGRWNGVYTYGDRTILHYTITGTDIHEMPSSFSVEGSTAFARSIQTGIARDTLFTVLAEFSDVVKSEVVGSAAYLYHKGDEGRVTIIGLSGRTASDGQVYIHDNRYVVLGIPPNKTKSERTVLLWSGNVDIKVLIEQKLKEIEVDFPRFKKGGKPYWEEKVYTKGKIAPDTSAYVLDQLILPLPNPWKRNMRVADVAFFKDGRAALVTFSGDVWIVDNINAKLDKIEWSRYASGLYEPMSIVIHEEKIYVFGKDGVIRLHDLNKDGNADYYENFSSGIIQSMDSREWAADMAVGVDGYFYLAKGGGAMPPKSPSITSSPKLGYRASSAQAGTVLRVSPDGKDVEVYATGLRAPYIGLHPTRNFLTVSDQQGNFVPATPIYDAEQGDYFGVLPAAHGKDSLLVKRPLVWIPHRVDRSSISQLWVTSDKMGPLNHSMVHFSFGRPGLFTVLIDTLSKVGQGGVSYISANYPAPVLKGAIGPKDGQLYVAGFNLWGSNSTGISAFTRLRYTGKSSYLPIGFQAGRQGVILRFSEKLDKTAIEDTKNFKVKRWNYLRTEKYGSGHYLLSGEPGEETLPILSSHLGKDGKSVLLVLPNMAEVMQMELTYELVALDGMSFRNEFHFTVNDISPMNLGKGGFDHVRILNKELVLTEKELADLQDKHGEVSVKKGAELFNKSACVGCHSIGSKTDGMYGPPFAKLYGSKRKLVDGSTVVADEGYLKESILEPTKKVVKGYGDEMPSFSGILSDPEIESLILYLKSL